MGDRKSHRERAELLPRVLGAFRSEDDSSPAGRVARRRVEGVAGIRARWEAALGSSEVDHYADAVLSEPGRCWRMISNPDGTGRPTRMIHRDKD